MYRVITFLAVVGLGKMFFDHYNNVQRHINQTDELLKIVKETNNIVKKSQKNE